MAPCRRGDCIVRRRDNSSDGPSEWHRAVYRGVLYQHASMRRSTSLRLK